MRRFFEMTRSGYYAFVRRLGKPDRDAERADIIAAQRERSLRTDGWNGKGSAAILKPYRGS